MNSNGFGVTVVLVVLAIFVIVVLLRNRANRAPGTCRHC